MHHGFRFRQVISIKVLFTTKVYRRIVVLFPVTEVWRASEIQVRLIVTGISEVVYEHAQKC